MKMSKAPVLCIEDYFLFQDTGHMLWMGNPCSAIMLDRITIGCSAGGRRLLPKKVQQKFPKEVIMLF